MLNASARLTVLLITLTAALAAAPAALAREADKPIWPAVSRCSGELTGASSPADPPDHIEVTRLWPKLTRVDRSPDVNLGEQTPLWRLFGLPGAPEDIAGAERPLEEALRSFDSGKRVPFALRLLRNALPRPTQTRLAIAWEMIAGLIHKLSLKEVTLLRSNPWEATRLFAADGSIVYRGPFGPAIAIHSEGGILRGFLGDDEVAAGRLVDERVMQDWDAISAPGG